MNACYTRWPDDAAPNRQQLDREQTYSEMVSVRIYNQLERVGVHKCSISTWLAPGFPAAHLVSHELRQLLAALRRREVPGRAVLRVHEVRRRARRDEDLRSGRGMTKEHGRSSQIFPSCVVNEFDVWDLMKQI